MAQRRARRMGDASFYALALAAALLVLALVVVLVARMTVAALPSIQTFGFHFVTQTTWNPNLERFGALAFLGGTLYSSFLALVLAVPVSLGIALFLTQWAPIALRSPIGFLVELLAAIPSVVYGLWGIWVLVPLVRPVEVWLSVHARVFPPFTPFFSGAPYGFGMLSAGLLLTLMILPTITAISRDVMATVPHHQIESALALGATRWEAARLAILRSTQAGLIGAVVLGLGRALGETMAVTMVIGNQNVLSLSLLSPGQTMASAIANQFNEANTQLYVAALIEVGLLLFVVSTLVAIAARGLVRKLGGSSRGVRVAGRVRG